MLSQRVVWLMGLAALVAVCGAVVVGGRGGEAGRFLS